MSTGVKLRHTIILYYIIENKNDTKSVDTRLNDSIRIAALTGDIGYSEQVVFDLDRAKESHNERDGRIFLRWDG